MAKRTSFYDEKFLDQMCDRIGLRGNDRDILREVFKKEDVGKATPAEQLLIKLVIKSSANEDTPKAKRSTKP